MKQLLRQAQDQRTQDWASSGTPVPAIGGDHVLLGTPVIGWGTLFGNPQAPPENPGRSTAAAAREATTQPQENGDLEDGEQGPLIPLEDVSSLPREEPTQADELA